MKNKRMKNIDVKKFKIMSTNSSMWLSTFIKLLTYNSYFKIEFKLFIIYRWNLSWKMFDKKYIKIPQSSLAFKLLY